MVWVLVMGEEFEVGSMVLVFLNEYTKRTHIGGGLIYEPGREALIEQRIYNSKRLSASIRVPCSTYRPHLVVRVIAMKEKKDG